MSTRLIACCAIGTRQLSCGFSDAQKLSCVSDSATLNLPGKHHGIRCPTRLQKNLEHTVPKTNRDVLRGLVQRRFVEHHEATLLDIR